MKYKCTKKDNTHIPLCMLRDPFCFGDDCGTSVVPKCDALFSSVLHASYDITISIFFCKETVFLEIGAKNNKNHFTANTAYRVTVYGFGYILPLI